MEKLYGIDHLDYLKNRIEIKDKEINGNNFTIIKRQYSPRDFLDDHKRKKKKFKRKISKKFTAFFGDKFKLKLSSNNLNIKLR